jgi:hypothetical protein
LKKIAIIGGGISGISNAIHLIKCGYEVTIFEKSGSLGGIWTNGIANKKSHLQTPSFLYYFSWKVKWKNRYPFTDEIKNQILKLSSELEKATIYYNCEVIALSFCENECVKIETSSGHSMKFIGCIVATGLHQKENQFKLHNINSKIKFISFSEIDTVQSYMDKQIIILGMGASAIEAFNTVSAYNAKKISFVSTSPRWVFPNNFLYFIISFFPFTKPDQIIEKFVYNQLKKTYIKNNLECILPILSPAKTKPGSISNSFFRLCNKLRPSFYTYDSIKKINNNDVILNSGIIIPDVDIVIACTGWQTLNFDFLKDSNLRKDLDLCIEKGYLYLHEFVPGYNNIVFSNYKSGFGSTGFAPYISSILLQNYLEQKEIFPSKSEQNDWLNKEELKWEKAPNVFQFINMYESIKSSSKFFSNSQRGRWFINKIFIKNKRSN